MSSSAEDQATKKARFVFRWLRAIKRDPRLKSVDALTALDAIEWLDDDLEFYRSARKLGEAIRVSESTAAASQSRLRDAGFLSRVAGSKAARSMNGGRLANTYRLEIPESQTEVSTENSVETVEVVSTGRTGKTEGVSTGNSVEVSTENPVTISLEQSLEGGRASRAPANSLDEGCDTETVLDASAGARERARSDDAHGPDHSASDPEVASFLFLVPEHAPADGIAPLPVLNPKRGRHITLEERDMLAAGWLLEDCPLAADEDDFDAAVEAQEAMECAASARAVVKLERLHGWPTGDAETLVFEAVRGCVYGARDGVRLAGDLAYRVMSGVQEAAVAQTWRQHLAVMRTVFAVHAGAEKAETAIAVYARAHDAAKGLAARTVEAKETIEETCHG